MVAIVAGNGLGLFNTSMKTVGPDGVFGQSLIGRGSDRAIVNVTNGNLVLQTQDAQLAGRGADLFALRTYNSLGLPNDSDADGWRWGYEQTVKFLGPGVPAQPGPGSAVVRTEGDGHETFYTWDVARGIYVGTEGNGAYSEMKYDSDASEWIWIDGSSRLTERYSNSTDASMTGLLVRRTDTSNNSIALSYDFGRLTSVRDTASQQELRMTYGTFNGLTRLQHLEARLLNIEGANGTGTLGDALGLVDYYYDSFGRLTKVIRHLRPAQSGAVTDENFTTIYGYEGSSSRIASVLQSDGTSASFIYDDAGRVSVAKDQVGSPAARLSFVYGPQPNSTAITDGDGQVWMYRHDEITGQLTEVVRPPVAGTPASTTFRYDGLGNLIGLTDPRNNSVTYGYDSDGNCALVRDAIGNTTTRTFSPLNQVLTETRYRIPDPDGSSSQSPTDPATTRYVYDSNSRLRFVVSAEGRVTESRYGNSTVGYGLLTQSLLYVSQLYDVTALGPAQQLSEINLMEWIAGLPDKTQVQLTDYSYDLRGNVSQQTNYATVNTGGAGVLDDQATVAGYVYDAYSNLQQRIDVRGSARDQRKVVTSLAYDGMTRVLERSGANGTETTVYDDVNSRVTVTTASGLTETREYDSRGRLESISQTGEDTTRQTRYVYDNTDRLRMVEDAQQGQRYRFYDAAGRLEYQVDATGAVTRFEYNPTGHLVRQIQYLNRVNTDAWFDSATRTVSKTSLSVGGPNSDVTVDEAHDRMTLSDYDEADRLTATTDAVGTVTTISYDGMSRVVMTQTGERVTRYLYDKDDRRVGIVDPLRYFTEYKYDAGGRLTATIRYIQPSPAGAEGEQPSDWRPADPSALDSYLYYDGQGRVVGAVDEQQFLTETVYDDANNTQRTLRYLTPVTVTPGDDLDSLKSRAGTSLQISLIQFDTFGRVHEVTGQDGSTVTRNEYDEAGRLVRVVSAANTSEERVRHTFQNAFGEVTATLGGEGAVWLGPNPTPQRIEQAIRDYGIRYEYDTLGRMIRSTDANGNKTLFYYDRESRRTHVVNVIGQSPDHSLAGESSETTYNSFGQPESVRRYAARFAEFDMDQLLADGGGGLASEYLLARLVQIADEDTDQLTIYEYDRGGRLVKQVDGEQGFTENGYNLYGELVTQVQSIRNGQTTTKKFDRDLRGRVVSQTGDVGGINAHTRSEYDAFGRVTRLIDATDRVTTTAYENRGRSIAVTDQLQRTTRTEYDALGRVSLKANALGQQTHYSYDEASRSVTVETPEGSRVTTKRTAHDELMSVKDGRGNITQYGFNRDGQPTTVTDALGRMISQIYYDKSGRKVEVTDARGTVTRFGYDQRNQVVEQRVDPTGLNVTTLSEYNALGQQFKVTEGVGTPAARLTRYSYDRKGRTKKVELDAGGGGLKLSTTYEYDGLDNVVNVARGNRAEPYQHVTLYETDNLGRRVTEIAAPSLFFDAGDPGTRDLTTRYRYDASGRLTRRIDPNGHSTWQVYDSAGRQTHSIGHLGEVSETRYDAAGRVVYSHSYLNLLSSDVVSGLGDIVTSPAIPVATTNDRRSYFVYDGDGRVRFNLKATGASGWVIHENRYDDKGNVVEARNYDKFLDDARIASLDTDGSISVAEIQHELSNTLGYSDDDTATLVGVQRTFFAYDENNRLRFTVDPSGSVRENVFDAAGNMITAVRFANRPSLARHTEAEINAAVERTFADNRVTHYVFDSINRLRYTVDSLDSISENEYDPLGKVVRTERWAMRPVLTDYSETYITAALANLPTDEKGLAVRFVYDRANRLRYTVDEIGSVIENEFDSVGNIIVTTRFAQRPVLASGTLTESAVKLAVAPLRDDDENQVTHFAYDVQQRLRFKVDTLGSVIESVYDANGNLLATTRFAMGLMLAKFDEKTINAAVSILRADPENRGSRFAYDALNRLRFSVDALGSVSERMYDALGNLTSSVRFAVRPQLTEYSEGAIDAALTPERDHPGNRIEHHLYDALGRDRFNLLRVSLEAGEPRYQVTEQELNALGQVVFSAAYVNPMVLGEISESEITASVGDGDPSRDRVSRFIYDLAGRQTYRLQAVTVEANRRKYRVSEQRFDAFGQMVRRTDYATAVTLDAFDQTSIEAAVEAGADSATDRLSAIVYDALGQQVYKVQGLDSTAYQLVKQEHNLFGRVIKTTQYVNVVGPLATFDRATIEAAANAVVDANDRKTQYVYDPVGRTRFVLQADKAGKWTVGESRYDGLGNLVESRRYDQFVTDEKIDAINEMHPFGATERAVTKQLALLGYSDSTPDSLAKIQRTIFVYDQEHRVRFTIDALGSVVENVYNLLGDLTSTVGFATRPALSQYTESALNLAVGRGNPNNRLQHFAYDVLGQLRFTVQVIEPNWSAGKHLVTERRYDALGQLVESRAYATAVGHLVRYDEATLAAAVVVDVTNDRRSAVAYDAAGRQAYTMRELLVGQDPHYILTRQLYDAVGQVVQRVEYAKSVVLTQFDIASVQSAAILDSENDRTTTYVSDAAGRLRFEIRPDLSFRESQYDALDQVIETALFNFRLPSSAKRTETEMVALRGDHAVGDGVTRGEVRAWDAAGRLLSTVDALGYAERYEYDALGSRKRWTDKNNNVWTCAYDRKGQKTGETSPPVKFKLRGEDLAASAVDRVIETRFDYDAFGNLIRKIEAANFPDDASTTEFQFDNLGRPLVTLYNGYYDEKTGVVEKDYTLDRFKRGSHITYDTLGNAVRVSTRSGLNNSVHNYRTYDIQGRTVHEVNPLNHVTRYTYNSFGEQETSTRYSVSISGTPQNDEFWIASEIDPQLNLGLDESGQVMEDTLARTTRLDYDKFGRKSVVTSPTATFYSTHMPDPDSLVSNFRPNPPSVQGVEDAPVTRYEYNAFGDLILQRVRSNNIVEWQGTLFSHDAMGRRTQTIDAGGYVSNTTYDAAGNLERQEDLTGESNGTDRITQFGYNALDQQTRVDRYGLWYTDADGVEHGADAGEATTVRMVTYDGYGRVRSATDAAGNNTTMRYNALGELIEIKAASCSRAPIAANGEQAVDPFHGQDSESLVTSITPDVFGRTVRLVRATEHGQDSRETWQSYDFGGNPVRTTDAEGNVKFRSYDSAGRVVSEVQPIYADLGPLGVNQERPTRLYFYDAVGQLTDTLDVYVDDTDVVQSGKSVVYNAFGEVVEEMRKWGPVNLGPGSLNTAKVASYRYDNVGQVSEKSAADGRTIYYHNLLGQVTREEKLGDQSDLINKLVTEYQYNLLGRATMVRQPEFNADVDAGEELARRLVTPYIWRVLDRWGNPTTTEEGGYWVGGDGQTYFARDRAFRRYRYDDNNLMMSEELGEHEFVTASGDIETAVIFKLTSRDLLGKVVREVDEARDQQSGLPLRQRARRKKYDNLGRLTEETDATERTVEYVYNIHGERLGTRNQHGTVFFDRRDRNGNLLFHGVLRTLSGEYDSHNGTGPIVRTYLTAHLYDQANRRFASKSFTGSGDVPWLYTWLDSRSLGTRQRNLMGVTTHYRFDPFGNKAAETDGAGVSSEWNASTADYVVGRIDSYFLPSGDNILDSAEPLKGEYTYDGFGQVQSHKLSKTVTEYTMTEYSRHGNGMVYELIIHQGSSREFTRYDYNARGQMTMEVLHEIGLTPTGSSVQTKAISYDNQGRFSNVVQSKTPGDDDICIVHYDYDEWGNVRHISAKYTIDPNPDIENDTEWDEKDSWYDYDAAGRMTISNGKLSEGPDRTILLKQKVPGSVHIRYDQVGRRSGTTEYLFSNSVATTQWQTLSGIPSESESANSELVEAEKHLLTWDSMRDESYGYDDLGHLRWAKQRIRQIHIIDWGSINDDGEGDDEGDDTDQVDPLDLDLHLWDLSIRTVNLRGEVTTAQQWTQDSAAPNNLHADNPPIFLGTTTTKYLDDGQVDRTETADGADPQKVTTTEYHYVDKLGLMDSYKFYGFRSDGTHFDTTFTYLYSFENGVRVLRNIKDSTNKLETSKLYDWVGRLGWDHVELPNPTPGTTGPDRFEDRYYNYDAEGRVILKRTQMQLMPDISNQAPLPDPSGGRQTYVYVDNRIVAAVGAERLIGATRFDFAYTPMSEAATGGNSRYVVQNGDSLIAIAQACYGDSALWYAVADANGVAGAPSDILPTSEVGKAYGIPNVVSSVHSATTFAPFPLTQIFGPDRPLFIPAPPPPKLSDLEMITLAATSIAIQTVVTVGLTAAGVPPPLSAALGAGLSNLGGQIASSQMGIELPGHDGIDWGSVAKAGMAGAGFSMLGPASTLGREVWQQGQNGFENWTSGPGLNTTGIAGSMFNIGFDALGPAFGSVSIGPMNFDMGRLVNSAFNPSSGWAMPGTGHNAKVGAFAYAFGEVANSLILTVPGVSERLDKQREDEALSRAKYHAGLAAYDKRRTTPRVVAQHSQFLQDHHDEDEGSSSWWLDDSYTLEPQQGDRVGKWQVVVIDGRRYWALPDPSTGRLLTGSPVDELPDPTYSTLVVGERSNEEKTKVNRPWTFEEYLELRKANFGPVDSKLTSIGCVYDAEYEDKIFAQESAMRKHKGELSPYTTSIGIVPGGNRYMAESYYGAMNRKELEEAKEVWRNQATLGKIDSTINAGVGGLVGGGVGALGSWFGGRSVADGFAGGAQLGGFLDAFFGVKADAIVLKNATAWSGSPKPAILDLEYIRQPEPLASPAGTGSIRSGINAFVGTRGEFRAYALSKLQSEPNNPLRFLLNESGTDFKKVDSRTHSNLIDNPHIWEAGHIVSDKIGGDKLMIQSAWENQMQNITVEHMRVGGAVLENPVVEVGGFPVARSTVLWWEREGLVPPGTAANAPEIH